MRIAAGNPAALFAGQQWAGDQDKRPDVVLAGPRSSAIEAGWRDVPLVFGGI